MREQLFSPTRRFRPWYAHVPTVLLAAASLWCVFFSLSFSLCQISGPSMENTLHNGQYVVIKNGNGGLYRGALVVFDAGRDAHIKRIIGMGGDELTIAADDGGNLTVLIGGDPLAEPYIKDGKFTLRPTDDPSEPLSEENERFVAALRDGLEQNGTYTFTVPDDELFVLGDNREVSYDSRNHGTVAVDRVVAVVSDLRETVELTLRSGRTCALSVPQAFRLTRTLGLFFGYIGLASLFFASETLLYIGGQRQ